MSRLFPREVDNCFAGYRAALWLLALLVTLKLVMSINSIFNTAAVAQGADGIPLDTYGTAAAGTVLMLFALMSLGQLTIALFSAAVLIRWRAMVPFTYLLLIGEHLARRFIVQSYSVARTENMPAWANVNYAILALLVLGLVLSLARRDKHPRATTE